MTTARLEDSATGKVEEQKRSSFESATSDSFRQELFSPQTKWTDRIPALAAAQRESESSSLTFVNLPELETNKPKESRVKKWCCAGARIQR